MAAPIFQRVIAAEASSQLPVVLPEAIIKISSMNIYTVRHTSGTSASVAGVCNAAAFAASPAVFLGFAKFLNLLIKPVGVLGVCGSNLAGPVHPEKSSGVLGITACNGGCRMREEK